MTFHPENSNIIAKKSIREKDKILAAKILKNGGIVIHPTETVYGVAAIWNNEDAIRNVANLKQRDFHKPFSIMASEIEQILSISGWKSAELKLLLQQMFPSPLTLLLPREYELPTLFWNQFDDIGFRIPDHPLSINLIDLVGEPLITTSANIANHAPPKTASEVDESLVKKADLMLDGGDCLLKIPSTVLKFNPQSLEINVVRQGAFDVKDFVKQVKNVYG